MTFISRRNFLRAISITSAYTLTGERLFAATRGGSGKGTVIERIECFYIKKTGGSSKKISGLRIVARDGADGFYIDPAGGRLGQCFESQYTQPLREVLAGQDSADITALWLKMHESGIHHRLHAAADVALWDLHGRREGKNVSSLIGEKKRDKVKRYESTACNLTVDEYVEQAEKVKARGLQGFKLHPYIPKLQNMSSSGKIANPIEKRPWKTGDPIGFPEQDLDVIHEVHNVLGADVVQMLDNYHTYTLEQSIRVGRVLDSLNYGWMESPMPEGDDRINDYKTLRDTVKTQICAPEINHGDHFSRLRWLKGGAIDINRTDVNFGGFTSCLLILRACEEAGIPLDLHAVTNRHYQHALYPVSDARTMPWIEFMCWIPPVAEDFSCVVEGAWVEKSTPWFKSTIGYPTDSDGYVHFNYNRPGLGNEVNGEWVLQNRELLDI
ncbi:D-galactarolactone cycloisomerase [Pontiella desulfatans]|uniref:D-galactarolactone cycloisomerase n=1 Tax=Pontiella desulfatans TaxID=2750659 RepID=A0A6C2U5C8_PONDE|nr:enolase C-terminal domain-like protein [Pontiella desulfatans]VGO15083.1 D-galactarolactone cycloisomerase [Pontiella desulfatans]